MIETSCNRCTPPNVLESRSRSAGTLPVTPPICRNMQISGHLFAFRLIPILLSTAGAFWQRVTRTRFYAEPPSDRAVVPLARRRAFVVLRPPCAWALAAGGSARRHEPPRAATGAARRVGRPHPARNGRPACTVNSMGVHGSGYRPVLSYWLYTSVGADQSTTHLFELLARCRATEQTGPAQWVSGEHDTPYPAERRSVRSKRVSTVRASLAFWARSLLRWKCGSWMKCGGLDAMFDGPRRARCANLPSRSRQTPFIGPVPV